MKLRWKRARQANPPQHAGGGSIHPLARTYRSLLDDLRSRGLTIPDDNFYNALEGFLAGQEWILRQFNYSTLPNVRIGDFAGLFEDGGCYFKTADGVPVIALHISTFNDFGGDFGSETVIEHYGEDIPVFPRLLARQYFEGLGVEETLHYLQDGLVEGLAPIPPNDSRVTPDAKSGLIYKSQPHELEALTWIGRFFVEKYGQNPYAALESFVRSHAESRSAPEDVFGPS